MRLWEARVARRSRAAVSPKGLGRPSSESARLSRIELGTVAEVRASREGRPNVSSISEISAWLGPMWRCSKVSRGAAMAGAEVVEALAEVVALVLMVCVVGAEGEAAGMGRSLVGGLWARRLALPQGACLEKWEEGVEESGSRE